MYTHSYAEPIQQRKGGETMVMMQKLAKFRFALIAGAALLMGMLLAPALTQAQGIDPDDTFGLNPVEEGVGDSLGNQDLRTTVASIINVALSLLGIVAVVIILIGGFQWMTAGGNDDKVAGARKLIFSGIIGLAIILSAWAIATFVISSLSAATDSGRVSDSL